jgi:broad specificity phosphatase PhoE
VCSSGPAGPTGHTVENSIPLSIFPIQADKVCLCFCGKPARGKTQISRRAARYLSFFHNMPVEIFNVGEYRRKKGYFSMRDIETEESNVGRNQCNEEALEAAAEYMMGPAPRMVIYDAVNYNHDRRMSIYQKMREVGTKVCFIEVSNDDPDFHMQQYKLVASTSPDYAGVDPGVAIEDYKRRVENYCQHYVPISADHPIESTWSFFQCNNSKNIFTVHKATGYYFTKVIQYIMNMTSDPHTFFLSRHGESKYNEKGQIGGNSGLSEHGLEYARLIATFADEKIGRDSVTGEQVPARLWTSTMRRTIETAQFIATPTIPVRDYTDSSNIIQWQQMRPRPWCNLDELYAGSCDGMTYAEIEQRYPEEFARRSMDKLAYRYPRGESYLDVIARLEPMIMEMERHREPLLIISHQGILRIIYAFYMGLRREDAPFTSIPLNTVVELTPNAFTCECTRHMLQEKPQSDDGQNEPVARSGKELDPPSH